MLQAGDRYFGKDYYGLNFEEAKPIMFGTVSVVGGVLTGGIAVEAGEIGWALYATGSILFGLDDIGSSNGQSFVENHISSEELKKYYSGGKTIYATIGGVKSLIDLRKIGSFKALAADGDKMAKEIIKFIDGLNSNRSAYEGTIDMIESTRNADE